jgi:hypothetical protein
VRKSIGGLWIVGIFGFSAAAIAQTPPPPTAGTRFDGTYAFVSATKVNKTYTTRSGRLGQCGSIRQAEPLTIANGQARFNYGRQRTLELEGTVGSQGELAMRLVPTSGKKGTPGIERVVRGRIDGAGTVTARDIGPACDYDFVWRKEPR